jgi:hypothetical protein
MVGSYGGAASCTPLSCLACLAQLSDLRATAIPGCATTATRRSRRSRPIACALSRPSIGYSLHPPAAGPHRLQTAEQLVPDDDRPNEERPQHARDAEEKRRQDRVH